MDRQLGEVRGSLQRHGYAENTLFLFSSDQGAQWPFAKWNLYDAGMRVPLVASWPGHVRRGASTRAMVSLIDVLPTFLDAAGAPASPDLDGRSFLPVLTGKTTRLRDEVFGAHTGDKEMNRAPSRSLRTNRWKLIVNLAPEGTYRTHISAGKDEDGRDYWSSWLRLAATDARAARFVQRYEHRPAVELYDLERDPWELEDLAADPKHARTRAELRRKLDQWRLQQGEDLAKVPMPEDARLGQIPYAK
jgi:arylsulfatase A-like enzyme